MVAASAGIGIISLSVWAHHMFTVGMNSASNAFFVLSTGLVGVPTGIKDISTGLRPCGEARFVLPRPCFSATAFVVQFLFAGLTGIMLSIAPWNWQLHNSYFVVAHFHYVLVGAIVFCFFCRLLLLVPENDGQDAGRAAGQVALLAVCSRFPHDVRFHAYSRACWVCRVRFIPMSRAAAGMAGT